MNDFAWEEQGTMQAFVAASLFAINEGVGKIGLRQLLLGILSAYSESEDIPGSIISPHEARAILADCGVELVRQEPPSESEHHLAVPHQDVPIDEEVAQVLGEALQPKSKPPTLDGLLKGLQPMLAKSLSSDESKLSLERQLCLYLRRPLP